MKIFESLDKVSNEEMESKILKKWKSEDILNKKIERIARTLYSMMDQYMRMLNLVFIMYLLKL